MKKFNVSRETARGTSPKACPSRCGCGCERERYGKLGVLELSRRFFRLDNTVACFWNTDNIFDIFIRFAFGGIRFNSRPSHCVNRVVESVYEYADIFEKLHRRLPALAIVIENLCYQLLGLGDGQMLFCYN